MSGISEGPRRDIVMISTGIDYFHEMLSGVSEWCRCSLVELSYIRQYKIIVHREHRNAIRANMQLQHIGCNNLNKINE